MRAIDADALRELIHCEYSDDLEILEKIDAMPTIEPMRKKGKWVVKENIFGVAYCSECDYELHTNDTNFCPNCGADMRGEQDG